MLTSFALLDHPQWSRWLADEGTTILLVDHESEAADYRRRIADSQQVAWLENLQVVPKAQWWVALWDTSFPSRQVLRPVQLLALAEQCLENSPVLPEAVIGLQGIARRFVDAFEIVERYGVALAPTDVTGPDQEAFLVWQQALRERLVDMEAISAGQLVAALLTRFAELELPLRVLVSHQLEFCGPELALLKKMQAAGVTVNVLPEFSVKNSQRRIQQLLCQTAADEIVQAAQWAATRLGSVPETGAQAPRLAIVAPDIASVEPSLQRALEQYLYPLTLFPGNADGTLNEPWRVGTGKLLGYPVISAALDVLQVATGEIELEQLSRLLRSPFIAEAQIQWSARARLDWHWREYLQNRTALGSALREAQYAGFSDTVAPFQALGDLVGNHTGRCLPSVWVERFDQELLATGWPNREAGDPVLDQCRQGFSQVMDTLRALDRQLGQISRTQALRWLQHVLQQKRFELRRDEAPRLQLLSLEEAAGQHFDGLWILGLTDTALPLALEPSPFLPRRCLRAAAVPRADHHDALARDQRLLESLLVSAAEIVVSRAGQSEEGVPQSGCTLIDWRYPAYDAKALEKAYAIVASSSLPEADPARPVSPAERQRLRGGTGIFKAFAASPFFAFLKYRLRLDAMPVPVEGLDARIQGQWIHQALDYFWARVKSSDALAALSDVQTRAILEDAVTRAMTDAVRHGDELQRIEKRRILVLLEEWVAFERARTEPFVVEAREVGGKVDAFGIPLRIQIDRLDRIGDRRAVLDYKTGSVSANALNAENLREPQLPLYALLAESVTGEPVDGVVLAQIHPREGMMVHMRSNWTANLVDKKTRNPVDSPEKWEAELSAWRKVLTGYANGFLAGDIGHDFTLGAGAFPYDPYVSTLVREEVLDDE